MIKYNLFFLVNKLHCIQLKQVLLKLESSCFLDLRSYTIIYKNIDKKTAYSVAVSIVQ